jgi:hypothetical protein
MSEFLNRKGRLCSEAAGGLETCYCPFTKANGRLEWGTGASQVRLTHMNVLTEAVADVLNRLTLRPDAARSWILFIGDGSIFWRDEMPDFATKRKFSTVEHKMVDRLFEIRRKIWSGAELSAEDEGFWEAARLEAPKWALYQRLSLSDDDREYIRQVEEEAEKAFEMLCAEADEVKVTDKGDGTEEISVRFDLTKDRGLGAPSPSAASAFLKRSRANRLRRRRR